MKAFKKVEAFFLNRNFEKLLLLEKDKGPDKFLRRMRHQADVKTQHVKSRKHANSFLA